MSAFVTIITELWAALDQGAPLFKPDKSVQLDFDTVKMTFSPDASGRKLILSATLGSLASNQVESSLQLRQVLESNVRHLRVSLACVFLKKNSKNNFDINLCKSIDINNQPVQTLIVEIEKFISHYSNVSKIITGSKLDKDRGILYNDAGRASEKMDFIFRP